MCNVSVFSRGKESRELTLVLAKLKEITYVISRFTLIRYLILLKMKSYYSPPNNTKYLVPS